MARKTGIFAFEGGLIQGVSQLFMKPGQLVSCQNYEAALNGGYRRIEGYERFDGQAAPSEQTFHKLNFDAGTGLVSVGDTATGAAAQGEVIAVIVETGAWGVDAAGYLILGLVSGAFVDDEDLSVGAVKQAEVNGLLSEEDEPDDDLKNTYIQAAMELARDNILDVGNADSCEGPVRGVFYYNDVVYAFRNNSGSTACNMYKHSVAGWVQCDLGKRIAFTSGSEKPSEGDTLVGAISGAEAEVRRVILDSGTWAGGDAAGRLILYSQTGTFQAEDLNVDGGTANVLTVGGDTTAQSLAASGSFKFAEHNFYGGAETKRMYGCDGVSKGFEWDGSTFVQIDTGMTVDTPNNVYAHKDHLFFAFGGSVQHSDTGLPYSWTGLLGASEIGMSDIVTGFSSLPGGVLAILNRNSTKILHGSANSGSDPWVLRDHSLKSGAIPETIQPIGQTPYFLDDLGISSLEATQKYGDFALGVISLNIDLWIQANKDNVVASSVSNTKGQYRLFFSDNSALYMTIGKKYSFMLQDLGIAPACTCQGESSGGAEKVFFGAADGHVYQLDKGDNFDGDAISAWFSSPFAHFKSPELKKAFYKIVLEVADGIDADTNMTVKLEYSNADPGIPVSETSAFEIESTNAGVWDEAVWGDFYWDQRLGARPEAYIEGVGVNAKITISSEDTYISSHTIYSAIVHYQMRGLRR